MAFLTTIHINAILKPFWFGLKVLLRSCLLLAFSHLANASSLTLSLEGDIPEAIEKNVLSYLGTLPNTDLERSAFIYSAKDKTNSALQSLGYYQSNIVAVVNKTPWQLILTITLNEPTLINNIDVRVIGEAKHDAAFTSLINSQTIKQGDKLHHGKYEALKSDLHSLALQRGYLNSNLVNSSITIKENYRLADIAIVFDSGARFKFGEVTFNDFNLDPALLSSLIPFKTDDFYSTEKFHQLQNQLQATQYFGSVLAVPAKKIETENAHTYSVPIKVTVTPAKSHYIDFGIGYSTDTQFRLSAGWRTPLINKYGHYQEAKIEYSAINPVGKFIYSIPWNHPVEDVLRFKITVEDDDYADLTTKFYSAQVGRAMVKNQWNRQVYLRFHQEAWQYDLNKNTPNLNWDEVDDVHYFIPGVTWSRTIREGSALDPSAGFRQTYNIEGAHLDTGSDNSFFRLHGRWNYITTLKPNHRLVTRAELGAIYIDKDAQLAPSLRFYGGGDQSIRGFAYQSIGSTIPSSSDPNISKPIVVGGTRLMIGSIEYQYYLNNKWRVALFSDGGSVANKGEFKPVYSLGSGIHYISPVGAIKLDFAYGIDDDNKDWRIHINLGAEL
jgi:translocation and assembly module TamA